ncbi:lipopolysaccharide biosynthesis protein [Pseudobutyrivibrio ruminis]|uniref:Membrane protein involved in the export of O-antigen and teichoic acid n=1 Tax=Pseudobutyrivibrio ruminis DSM 9787 TaxID=1123011 RepID=A0A285S910_9FIRM|nr:oligosaccharide flippase family protein [Pseudobutyrivibrio ruminis]SOC03957.1 Membrane protein involved in the export of O-antigen and teichoic acid [Pseudobutyrivibrio ruminis DSM 9787]
MKINRIKNTKRNVFFGIINQFVVIVLPFIVQTVTIRTLGIEYVGIKSLFSSILSVLSLTELGIGSAIVYNMYKPIAEDDLTTIGILLNFYKRVYRIIGILVIIIGVLLTPFLGYLIKGEYPVNLNLTLIFWLYVANTVVSYWMFAYKSSLLSAHQRTDVISIVGVVVQTFVLIIQIIVLVVTNNFYYYLVSSIIGTVLNNIIISVCVDRMYPEIICKGHLSNELKKNIRSNVAGLLIGKVCGITRNTFDNIFMSMFLGLTQAAMYSNYYYILSGLNGFTSIILTSLMAGVGNSIAIESKEKNYCQMMKLHTIYICISGWMAITMLCLYQPFMCLWVGTEYIFPQYIMITFPIYFFITKLGDIRMVYSDGAGLFWENRIRIILEGISNIILNYILVIKWGAFGIMLATIITLFIFGFLGATLVIFNCYFEHGMKEYLLNSISYLVIMITLGAVFYSVSLWVNFQSMLAELIFEGVICCTVLPAILFLVCKQRKDFREAFDWFKVILRKD